jgi:hypothetical protein
MAFAKEEQQFLDMGIDYGMSVLDWSGAHAILNPLAFSNTKPICCPGLALRALVQCSQPPRWGQTK